MPVPAQLARSETARELGGLALSCFPNENPMVSVRAAQWRNSLAKVGLPLPFWLVHDLGVAAVVDPSTVPIGPRKVAAQLPPAAQASLAKYAASLKEIASSEVLERARQWRLSDDLISVLLLRVLAPLGERSNMKRAGGGFLPLDPELYRDLDRELPKLFPAFDRTADLAFLDVVAAESLRLLIAVEQIDLDTLRLLGMFGAEASAVHALGMLDLLHALSSAEANDIANFSLDLLPSVLETRRASGQQAFAVDGYSGLARRGTIDSLMLSELAFDTDLFDQRFVENEVFYYAREKQHEEDRQIHYICVDASASMRGQRAIFARGLALTLVKKLLLRDEDVILRFFDSRLYDAMIARAGRREQGISVPYVLSFKGEHGRNYPKVFELLLADLERLARRERATPILYILTHAECHVPLDTIERLRTVARLYGVFMLPSTGTLELEYLSRLHTVQVVDEASLTQRDERAKRALDIVEDAGANPEERARHSHPGRAPKGDRTSVPPRDLDEDLEAMAQDILAQDEPEP